MSKELLSGSTIEDFDKFMKSRVFFNIIWRKDYSMEHRGPFGNQK